MLSAAPTPPEVEPVGKVVETYNIDSMYDGLGVKFYDDDNVNAGDLLYTSPPPPADDELRKAAEEFVRWYDSLEPENSIHAITLIHNLRAALNKGKS